MTMQLTNAAWDRFFDMIGPAGCQEFGIALSMFDGRDDLLLGWVNQRWHGDALVAFHTARMTEAEEHGDINRYADAQDHLAALRTS